MPRDRGISDAMAARWPVRRSAALAAASPGGQDRHDAGQSDDVPGGRGSASPRAGLHRPRADPNFEALASPLASRERALAPHRQRRTQSKDTIPRFEGQISSRTRQNQQVRGTPAGPASPSTTTTGTRLIAAYKANVRSIDRDPETRVSIPTYSRQQSDPP